MEKQVAQGKVAARTISAEGRRRKRRTAEEISDRILQAAAEIFEDNGFSGATTAAIAARAEVTEAQLFRSFGSKAELFREAVFKPLNRHFSDFHGRNLDHVERMEGQRDKAQAYIGELRAFLTEHSKMLMALMVARTYSPDSSGDVGEGDSLSTYFERGAVLMASRVVDPRVDPKLMVRAAFAAVLACVMFKDWIFPEGLASEDEISAAIMDFVLEGLSANDDPQLKVPD